MTSAANRIDVPHTVYLHRDEDGNVIYVGCTSQLKARTRGHLSQSAWFDRTVTVEVDSVHPSWQTGHDREAQLIGELAPPFNTQRKPPTHVPAAFDAPYSSTEVIQLTGATYRQLDYWCRTGHIGKADAPSPGSGNWRWFTGVEVDTVYWAVQLIAAGYTAQAALKSAPTYAQLAPIHQLDVRQAS